MIDIFNNFYKGKRVLVTGHTGFKGSWLSIWLHELGAEVVGVGLDPYSERDNFVLSGIGSKIKADIRADIRDGEKMTASVDPDKSINIEIFPSPINQIPPPIMNRQKRTSNDLTRPPIILHKNCNEIPLFPISFI